MPSLALLLALSSAASVAETGSETGAEVVPAGVAEQVRFLQHARAEAIVADVLGSARLAVAEGMARIGREEEVALYLGDAATLRATEALARARLADLDLAERYAETHARRGPSRAALADAETAVEVAVAASLEGARAGAASLAARRAEIEVVFADAGGVPDPRAERAAFQAACLSLVADRARIARDVDRHRQMLEAGAFVPIARAHPRGEVPVLLTAYELARMELERLEVEPDARRERVVRRREEAVGAALARALAAAVDADDVALAVVEAQMHVVEREIAAR